MWGGEWQGAGSAGVWDGEWQGAGSAGVCGGEWQGSRLGLLPAAHPAQVSGPFPGVSALTEGWGLQE